MTPSSANKLAGLLCALFAGCAQLEPPSTEFGSVAELGNLMREGIVSSEAVVKRALETNERTKAHNAFITIDTKGALRDARRLDALRRGGTILGPLHGIPIVVKDNIHVAGLPNTAGTPFLRNFIPAQDATAVSRLREAGAIVLGKTNMHELAFGITSANRAFGAVGNAHDVDFFAGGSSGGTATAIARHVAVAGLGTDTGGSSRVPAALNGIVGFRPTTGRYPSAGITRISSTRDTIGPMGKTVADVQLLDQVLSGTKAVSPLVRAADLRVGVPRAHFYEGLEPAIARAADKFLVTLAEAGVTLIAADLNQVAEYNAKVGFPIVLFESRLLLQQYLESNRLHGDLNALVEEIASPDVKVLMNSVVNSAVTEAAYNQALSVHRPALQKLYQDYFDAHRLDALIFPTTPLTARAIEGSDESVILNGEKVPTFLTFIRNTDPASNAGIPGLSIPLGRTDAGLPFGIEIDGPANSDRKLLAIGALLESLINSDTHRSKRTD